MKIIKNIYNLATVLLLSLAGVEGLVSCTDDLVDFSGSNNETNSYKGELVQFAAGNTVSSSMSRADGEGNEGGSESEESDPGSTYTVTPGKTYYMPDSYRFVCRMYYKAATGDDAKYDVSGNTDITAWLKVKGNVGNSLYWRNSFTDLGTDESLYDTYGNDKDATMFYWQNRKEHAFLAWTDLNRAKTIGYDPTPNSNTLKFKPEDIIYEKHTGTKLEQWIDNGFEVYCGGGNANKVFTSWKNLRTFMETDNNYKTYVKDKAPSDLDFENQEYYYAYGWSCKYRLEKGAVYDSEGLDENHRKYGWYEYQMFYDKLKYTGDRTGTDIEVRRNEKNVPEYLYNTVTNKYLAEIEIKYYKTDENGTRKTPNEEYTVQPTDVVKRTSESPNNATIQDKDYITNTKRLCIKDGDKYYEINSDGTPKMETVLNPEYTDETTTPGVSPTIQQRVEYVYTQESGDSEETVEGQTYTYIRRVIYVAQCVWEYNLTDEYGNVKYDENSPRYTFYYKQLQEKKVAEVVKELPANVFDLTRQPTTDADGNITSYAINSINEQPDIAQALTRQAPLGATQSANRVNLYFKHQFSQVQVNVKTSSDLSVVINKNHIQKVELLGVSEKGYVFTEIDEDGKVEPATYESVDVSQYTDEHLAKNQYGTAFNMFDMATSKDADGNEIASTDKTTADAGYALGYIKSYNALTFGQLQAIRITWNEQEDGSGISHESTYHVADETLKNLQSGYKYIWNIELRRGTLAIVRTEIVDWIVPQNELEYGTSGTISN